MDKARKTEEPRRFRKVKDSVTMQDAARIAEEVLDLPTGSLQPADHGNTKVKTVRERANPE